MYDLRFAFFRSKRSIAYTPPVKTAIRKDVYKRQQINGTIDSTTAFSKINDEDFNLLVTHCPDTLKSTQVNTNYIDLALARHSLGGQIYLPLFGPIKTIEGAVTYNHGSYTIGNTQLYVSNGLGTIDTDMRLFCPPEILVFRLEHGTTQTK